MQTAGLLIWLVALVVLPAPTAARILLLGPLVIVPRLLDQVNDRPWVERLAGWSSLGLPAQPFLSDIDRSGAIPKGVGTDRASSEPIDLGAESQVESAEISRRSLPRRRTADADPMKTARALDTNTPIDT